MLLLSAGGLSCGDDEVPPQQAVIWLGLSPAQGSTCSSASVYQVPETAMTTITGSDGVGDRVVDRGADTVTCSLDATGADGTFNVSLYYAGGAIAEFNASGAVSEAAGGTLEFRFRTTSFDLTTTNGGESCTASVRTLNERGAIWIDELDCRRLVDPRSPNIGCVATGGMIFENCR